MSLKFVIVKITFEIIPSKWDHGFWRESNLNNLLLMKWRLIFFQLIYKIESARKEHRLKWPIILSYFKQNYLTQYVSPFSPRTMTYVLQVGIKDTKITSVMSFWCCFSVCFELSSDGTAVDFEQVNANLVSFLSSTFNCYYSCCK